MVLMTLWVSFVPPVKEIAAQSSRTAFAIVTRMLGDENANLSQEKQ